MSFISLLIFISSALYGIAILIGFIKWKKMERAIRRGDPSILEMSRAPEERGPSGRNDREKATSETASRNRMSILMALMGITLFSVIITGGGWSGIISWAAAWAVFTCLPTIVGFIARTFLPDDVYSYAMERCLVYATAFSTIPIINVFSSFG